MARVTFIVSQLLSCFLNTSNSVVLFYSVGEYVETPLKNQREILYPTFWQFGFKSNIGTFIIIIGTEFKHEIIYIALDLAILPRTQSINANSIFKTTQGKLDK